MVRRKQKFKRPSFRQPAIYYRKPRKEKGNSEIFKKYFSRRAFLFYAIILIIYFIFFSSYFKIKDVIVDGCEISDQNKIADIIPNGKNILLVKNSLIEREILKSFPEIKEAQIYKGLPNAIKIIVLEYDKSLVWQSGERYYLVSSQGTISKEVTDKAADYVTLPRVVDKRNIVVKERQRILSPNFVSFALNVFKDFKTTTNIDPDYFWVDDTTVDITLQSKEKIFVKFDTLRSSKKQLDNLKSILIMKKSEISEYVDVRIDGWGYIK